MASDGVLRGAPGERSGFPPFAGGYAYRRHDLGTKPRSRRPPPGAHLVGGRPNRDNHASRRPHLALPSSGVLFTHRPSNAVTRPPHPASRIVTIANAPQCEARSEEYSPSVGNVKKALGYF